MSKEIGFNPDVRKALAEFVEAKSIIKQAEEQKAQAEAILREALGDQEELTVGGVSVCKVVKRTTTHVNRELLKATHPDIYESVLSQTHSDFLKVVV